jgi:hypothetical protein
MRGANMKEIDGSSRVFPIFAELEKYTDVGMAMRDYFAARAPKVPSWFLVEYSEKARETPEVIAKWAYAYADAMIKEGGVNENQTT